MKTTPDNITELKPNQVFVFGSNIAGVHGAGAARQAFLHFGAIWGFGQGAMGRSYAIPTKDDRIETMPTERIRPHVERFLQHARDFPKKEFLVTQIGCGLAGYSPKDIAPLFRDTPPNVVLPLSFLNNRNKKE